MSPFKTILVFVVLALVGFTLIPELPVELEPQNNKPQLAITYSLPDAPPEVVEQEATAPLENALSQIALVKYIYSISSVGQGIIELTFDANTDLNFKRFEVASIIRQLYPALHHQVTYPLIQQRGRKDKGKSPLLIYRVNSKLARFQIKRKIDESLIPGLAQMVGVSEVQSSGSGNIQIALEYDYAKLLLYKLTPADVVHAIREESVVSYPGTATFNSGQHFVIKTRNKIMTIKALENVLAKVSDHGVVRVKDVAKLYVEESQPTQYFRINGLNSVTLSVYADENVNRLALASTLKNKMIELAGSLPDIQVQLDYDDTEFLSSELDKNLVRSLLAFIALVIFISIGYRDYRYLIVLFSAIVVCLGVTALLAYALNITIHLYTIAGITISFGLIIDNAIIVTDQLSKKESKNILRAVVGATFTTILALLLVFFLPKEERVNLTDFCTIVSIALLTSILIAITFTPAVYRFVTLNHNKSRTSIVSMRRKIFWFLWYYSTIKFLARYRKILILILILTFGLPLFMLPSKWEGHNWYNTTIGNPIYQESIRPYVDKALGGVLRLFVRNVYERGGYRDLERTRLLIFAELPYGNTLEEMNRIILALENYLSEYDGVESYVSNVNSGQQASIAINFRKEYENGELPHLLKNRLIVRSQNWGGVEWSIVGVGQGFTNASLEPLPGFKVEMKGYNYSELERQANVLADKLLKHQRIQKVNTSERIGWEEKSVDHLLLNFAEIPHSPIHLSNALKTLVEESAPSIYVTIDNNYYPLYLKPQGRRLSTHDLTHTYLHLSDSLQIKLGSFTSVKQTKTANTIHKENRQYIRLVGYEYFGSSQFGNQHLDNVLAELKKELPVGYSAKKTSWLWDWEKTKRQYGLIFLLVIGIYMVGAILFENLRQPLLIIFVIPISFIGLFLAFVFGKFYFDQGGYAAFILLGGLVVNAAIFIVNDLNNSIAVNYNRAVIKSVCSKMKPILLTVLSTCLGLSPFLIGGHNEVFWFSLAVGTIGGLILSLFAVLVCLPVFLFNYQDVK